MSDGYSRSKGMRKSFLIRQSGGPIWQNAKQMKDISLNLAEEKIAEAQRATRRSAIPEIRTLGEIRHKIDAPQYISLIDNNLQVCRLWFNSQKNVCFIEHTDRQTKITRVSISYNKIARAKRVWLTKTVIWKTRIAGAVSK